MKTIWALKVYDDGIDNDVLSSDQEETLQEFIDTYITFVYDLFVDCGLDEKAEIIADKLRDQDYTVFSEVEDDTEYVEITVYLE